MVWAWVSSVGIVLYYIALPFVTILGWILRFLGIILAPVLHLSKFLWSACLLPLRWIAKFEVRRSEGSPGTILTLC